MVLAHLLHRRGIECTLFERHTRADLEARVAKAGSIDFRTVELLTRVGIAPEVLSFDVRNGRCEFRTPGESVVFDYAQLTGGRPHFVYPQHQLVARLCDTFDGDLRFGTTVTAITQDTSGVSLTWRDSGGHHTVHPSAIVGCDGARGQVAGALTGTTTAEEKVPCRLLAVIGVTAPLEPHTIYAGHPAGMRARCAAGRTSPASTSRYLQLTYSLRGRRTGSAQSWANGYSCRADSMPCR